MSLINIDEWASDNNIDTPKRLVNNGTWGINDYTQVFEDIFENNPNVTIELTAENMDIAKPPTMVMVLVEDVQ